jgi:hypothetical protein
MRPLSFCRRSDWPVLLAQQFVGADPDDLAVALDDDRLAEFLVPLQRLAKALPESGVDELPFGAKDLIWILKAVFMLRPDRVGGVFMSRSACCSGAADRGTDRRTSPRQFHGRAGNPPK